MVTHCGCAQQGVQEVSSALANQQLAFRDRETLVWEDASLAGACTFNLYRGSIRGVGRPDWGMCIAARLGTNTFVDSSLPGPGEGFTYLVSAKGIDGEGTLGSTSLGDQRMAAGPCP